MGDDQRIIERVLSGQTDAFRELVDLYQFQVFQFVRNLMRNTQDAEDLAQEIFVAAFQNLARFESSKGKFCTWLLTIARNRCYSRLQRRTDGPCADADIVDRAPFPDEIAAQREVWQHLDEALESLPLEQKTAFVLAEIQQLPYVEIAVIEGIEIGTVKSRVSRARDRLRQTLKAWQPDTASAARKHS